jgi:uncharacterized protein YjaG (DUF416 family)
MTTITKHASQVRERLQMMSKSQRVVFAAACGERLLPLYAAFEKEVGWGDVAALRRGVDQAWRFAKNEPVKQDLIAEVEAQCERAAPETEDFDSPLTSAALSAATAIGAALECVRLDTGCEAPAMAVLDAIYLTLVGPETTSEVSQSHPLLRDELIYQEAELLRLAGNVDVDSIREAAVHRGTELANHLREELALKGRLRFKD